MLNSVIIILGVLCILSITTSVILITYMRRVFMRLYNASEEASVIFTRLDTFREHLQTVYDTPTFYGDETLSALLEHVKGLVEFLLQYEDIFSLTQPDLIEQLEAASLELQEEHERQEAQKKEE